MFPVDLSLALQTRVAMVLLLSVVLLDRLKIGFDHESQFVFGWIHFGHTIFVRSSVTPAGLEKYMINKLDGAAQQRLVPFLHAVLL